MSAPTTRRHLLATVSGAACVGSTLVIAMPVDTQAGRPAGSQENDVELLAACAEFHRLDQAVRQSNAAFDHMPAEAHDAIWDDYSAGVWQDYNEAVRRLIALEPRTPEGLQAEARAAKTAFVNHVSAADDGADVLAGAGDEERLVISCFHAMAGGLEHGA